MSDLHPIADAVVKIVAELGSPDMLREQHAQILEDYKRDRDPEATALRFAHLAAVAIECLRHMEASHAGDPGDSDRDGAGGADRDSFWHAPQHTLGGGWRAAGPTPASVRPH